MPVPIIPIAMALAQFAPSLMKYFGAGSESVAVAEEVVGIAATITGGKTPTESVEILQANPELQHAFSMAVLSQSGDLEKAYLADRQGARDRDMSFTAAGKRNHRADALVLLAIGIIVLLIYIIWQTTELNEYIKGTFTFLLGRFTGYLDNIYNFEFGTTRTSKSKDDVISSLTKDR